MTVQGAYTNPLGGRFALPDEALHVGGHARLFKAYDLKKGREVAVKLFNPVQIVDPRTLKLAWSNELDAYMRLGTHANLLAMIEHSDPHEGHQWLAFEWCGEDLEAYSTLRLFDWPAFREIAFGVLAGLSSLHAKNYIHRDIKPKNILVGEEGVKVADFGTIRLREVTNFGYTMNQLGTPPFTPPESGTENPTTAYDVYSFAILVIACLSQDFSMRNTTPEILLAGLDLPEAVRAVLERCIEDEPQARPASAGIVASELRAAEKSVGLKNDPEIGLEITANALNAFRQLMFFDGASLTDVAEEFGPRARLVQDPKHPHGVDVMLVGRSVCAIATLHSRKSGFLVIKHLWKPKSSQIEKLRRRAVVITVKWQSALLQTVQAQELIDQALYMVREKAAAESENETKRSEVHDRWERVLEAKFNLARGAESDVNYNGLRIEGSRIFLSVEDNLLEIQLGALRTIRTSRGKWIRGEVETYQNGEIGLYVSDGSVEDAPRRGTLSIDSERTRSKLNRERSALRRVFEGEAARPDLRDILNNPKVNPAGVVATVSNHVQSELDSAKRNALNSIMGSEGISIVEGPPGTGKTTLIAEIIAQQILKDPQSRILLASQTHIALDHALSKVAAVSPAASVLRIGTPDQTTESTEPWTIPAQLVSWRNETIEKAGNFVLKRLSESGSSDAELRQTITNYRVAILRREELRNSLASLEERKDFAKRTRGEMQSRIDSLIDAVATVERSATNYDAEVLGSVDQLVTSTLSLSAIIADQQNRMESVELLDGRIKDCVSGIEELVKEARLLEMQLRQVPSLMDASSEEELATRSSALLSEHDLLAQEFRRLSEEWVSRFQDNPEFRLALLFRANVVASTCVALTGSRGADSVGFDLCIVDEASKATPTELMVPLASSKKWVLVGDEKQLPPFVDTELSQPDFLDRFDLTRGDIEERLFSGLSATLPDGAVSTLDLQHRMHPIIGDLVSQVFYQGNLKSNSREEDPVMTTAFGSTLVWKDIKTGSAERRVGTSFSNRAEASAIVALLDKLENAVESNGERKVAVAIIAGYAAQVAVLQELIGSARRRLQRLAIRVATIDSFQGQEADVCFLSMTRSNTNGNVGFLASPERLNVALSRPRNGLIVVGSMRTAVNASKTAPNLARVAEYFTRYGKVI